MLAKHAVKGFKNYVLKKKNPLFELVTGFMNHPEDYNIILGYEEESLVVRLKHR